MSAPIALSAAMRQTIEAIDRRTLMAKRLSPCGLIDTPAAMAMVGKGKTVPRLAERMPSPEVVAKVGAPCANIVSPERTYKVVRRKAVVA